MFINTVYIKGEQESLFKSSSLRTKPKNSIKIILNSKWNIQKSKSTEKQKN